MEGMAVCSMPCYLRMAERSRSCSEAMLWWGAWWRGERVCVRAQQGVGAKARGGCPSIAGSSRHAAALWGSLLVGAPALHPFRETPLLAVHPPTHTHKHTSPWSGRGSPIQVTAPSFGPNPAKGGAAAPCSSLSFGWRSGAGKARGRGRARALPFQMQPETKGN